MDYTYKSTIQMKYALFIDAWEGLDRRQESLAWRALLIKENDQAPLPGRQGRFHFACELNAAKNDCLLRRALATRLVLVGAGARHAGRVVEVVGG
jgi:hypothetical protein